MDGATRIELELYKLKAQLVGFRRENLGDEIQHRGYQPMDRAWGMRVHMTFLKNNPEVKMCQEQRQ